MTARREMTDHSTARIDGIGRAISDLLDRTHGERQRGAICRALLLRPRLLLADEPTGNLDPDNKRRILDMLLDQARQTQATLLCVTHDHSLLDDFDHVLDCADFHAGRQGG